VYLSDDEYSFEEVEVPLEDASEVVSVPSDDDRLGQAKALVREQIRNPNLDALLDEATLKQFQAALRVMKEHEPSNSEQRSRLLSLSGLVPSSVSSLRIIRKVLEDQSQVILNVEKELSLINDTDTEVRNKKADQKQRIAAVKPKVEEIRRLEQEIQELKLRVTELRGEVSREGVPLAEKQELDTVYLANKQRKALLPEESSSAPSED